MKAKKFTKKLKLNKKTIANLTIEELKKVYGGDPDQTPTASKFGICC